MINLSIEVYQNDLFVSLSVLTLVGFRESLLLFRQVFNNVQNIDSNECEYCCLSLGSRKPITILTRYEVPIVRTHKYKTT